MFSDFLNNWLDTQTIAARTAIGNSSDQSEAPSVAPVEAFSSPSDAQTYNDRDVYDEYLSFLQKGSQIGLFSTAQDVADQAQLDRDFQSLEAQKERDWYERLSDTAYQRQVADLEAAGLNPILGFAHGAGSGAAVASTAVPSGRSTNLSAIAPSLTDYLNAGANLISSAADIIKFFKPMLSQSISDITSRSNVTSRSVNNSTNYNYNYRSSNN